MTTTSERPAPGADPARRCLVITSLAVFAFVLLRTGWVADEAYVTFRTARNFIDGHGLTWNLGERVQAYAHPLWTLLLSAAFVITREAYFTSLALSMILAFTSVALLATRAASPAMMLLTVTAAVSSKAFVDFSTSGLEGPLSYLLLALVAVYASRGIETGRQLTTLAALTSLAMLSRLDNSLLLLPLVFRHAARQGSKTSLRALTVGTIPLVLWYGFAIVYYGMPLPNAAYSRLHSAVPAADFARAGLAYLGDSLVHDPVTLVTIAAAVVVFALRHELRSIAVGLLLHLVYIVSSGGDFMSGRLLSAPFFWSLLHLSRMPVPLRPQVVPVPLAAVVALGLMGTLHPLWSTREFAPTPDLQGPPPVSGIVDERYRDYTTTGFLWTTREVRPPYTPEVSAGPQRSTHGPHVVVGDSPGFIGWFSPSVHVVDIFADGDPLLARLPADPNWRAGRLRRTIPTGYIEQLYGDRVPVGDEHVERLYKDILLATRSTDLFSRERIAAIRRLFF